MEKAEAHLDAALALRGGLFAQLPPDTHEAGCFGLRAFVRASRGAFDGALADAKTTLAHPHAIPGSLAFALVAEGLVLQKRGEKAALRAFIASHRRALFELTTPRLRSIARALARFARTETASVYRRVARASAGRRRGGATPRGVAGWRAAGARAVCSACRRTPPRPSARRGNGQPPRPARAGRRPSGGRCAVGQRRLLIGVFSLWKGCRPAPRSSSRRRGQPSPARPRTTAASWCATRPP